MPARRRLSNAVGGASMMCFLSKIGTNGDVHAVRMHFLYRAFSPRGSYPRLVHRLFQPYVAGLWALENDDK